MDNQSDLYYGLVEDYDNYFYDIKAISFSKTVYSCGIGINNRFIPEYTIVPDNAKDSPKIRFYSSDDSILQPIVDSDKNFLYLLGKNSGVVTVQAVIYKNALDPSNVVTGTFTVQVFGESSSDTTGEVDYINFSKNEYEITLNYQLNKYNKKVYKSVENNDVELNFHPNTANIPTVYYESMDTSVFTVNASGVVFPISDGEAILMATAYDGSLVATTLIKVKVNVYNIRGELLTRKCSSISFDNDNYKLGVGDTSKVGIIFTPSTLSEEDIPKVTYVTDSNVCSVDADGKLTANAVGSTTITAYCYNDDEHIAIFGAPISARSVITVSAESVKPSGDEIADDSDINIESISISVNGQLRLGYDTATGFGKSISVTANISPTQVVNSGVTWDVLYDETDEYDSSLDGEDSFEVITVDTRSNGMEAIITPIGLGSCKLACIANDNTSMYSIVDVYVYASEISSGTQPDGETGGLVYDIDEIVDYSNITSIKFASKVYRTISGETDQTSITMYNRDARVYNTNKLTYESSDNSICSINNYGELTPNRSGEIQYDKKGKITGMEGGVAYIYCYAGDSSSIVYTRAQVIVVPSGFGYDKDGNIIKLETETEEDIYHVDLRKFKIIDDDIDVGEIDDNGGVPDSQLEAGKSVKENKKFVITVINKNKVNNKKYNYFIKKSGSYAELTDDLLSATLFGSKAKAKEFANNSMRHLKHYAWQAENCVIREVDTYKRFSGNNLKYPIAETSGGIISWKDYLKYGCPYCNHFSDTSKYAININSKVPKYIICPQCTQDFIVTTPKSVKDKDYKDIQPSSHKKKKPWKTLSDASKSTNTSVKVPITYRPGDSFNVTVTTKTRAKNLMKILKAAKKDVLKKDKVEIFSKFAKTKNNKAYVFTFSKKDLDLRTLMIYIIEYKKLNKSILKDCIKK